METTIAAERHPLKTVFIAPFLLFLVASNIAAAPATVASSIGYQSESEISRKFGVGAKRGHVMEVIGLPDARVSTDLWIYYHYDGAREKSKGTECDTLIVQFKKDRVVAMKLTSGSALRDLLAQRRVEVTGPSYADLLR
jgi:hypothetical protein